MVYDNDAVFGEVCLRPIPKLFYDAPHVNSNILKTFDEKTGEFVYTMKLPYAMAFTPIIQLNAKGGERLWLTSDHEWVNGGPGDEKTVIILSASSMCATQGSITLTVCTIYTVSGLWCAVARN